jgi:hypothetical protein
MSKVVKVGGFELVFVALICICLGVLLRGCLEKPAGANVTTDAEAIRRSIDHMERMMQYDLQHRYWMSKDVVP